MLPTSSELRRRSTTQRSSSSSSGIIISNSKDILVTDSSSSLSTSPWSSLPQQQQQQQHDGAPRAPRLSSSAASSSSSSSLSVNSLVSALRRPRVQALLCLCVTVLPWIYHSSQNHALRSVHTALARLLREHRQIVAGLEHSQWELERAERDAREIELDNKELADLLAESAAAAANTMQQQHADEVDSIEYLHHDEEEAAADSSSNRIMYREAQHLEDLYLERIGIIEAAIKNHSLHHLREMYLPPAQQSNYDDKDDENAKLYVEIRLVAEEEAVDDGTTRASSSAEEVLVLETAPISVAPHAIDHFLRLVEANYYGGRNFAMLHQPTVLPASHVMVGAANAGAAAKSVSTHTHRIHTVERQQQEQQQQHDAAVITDPKKRTTSNPEELNGSRLLTSMAFREHRHGAYPVQKYSVLFHGKPGGGPHFSIHMMDPSPRRRQQQQQGSDEDVEEVESEGEEEDWDHDDDDACFGRIVRGRDVLDRLVEASRSTKRQHRVVIDSVKLLPAGTW
jgi:cyclophilin family peptidyl-prolyl cis-trans isomerase